MCSNHTYSIKRSSVYQDKQTLILIHLHKKLQREGAQIEAQIVTSGMPGYYVIQHKRLHQSCWISSRLCEVRQETGHVTDTPAAMNWLLIIVTSQCKVQGTNALLQKMCYTAYCVCEIGKQQPHPVKIFATMKRKKYHIYNKNAQTKMESLRSRLLSSPNYKYKKGLTHPIKDKLY